MQQEHEPEDWEEPSSKGLWVFLVLVGIPWVLGVGVVGMYLLDLID